MSTRAWGAAAAVLGLLPCSRSGMEPAPSPQHPSAVDGAPTIKPSAGPLPAGPPPKARCGSGIVYGQRLANPQLNGLGNACLATDLERQIAFEISPWQRLDTPWLLMGESPRWLVGTAGGYVIDLVAETVVGDPADRILWAAMVPGERLVTLRLEALLVQNLGAPEGPRSPAEAWARAYFPMQGFYATATGFIGTTTYMIDPPPCRPGVKCSGEPIPGGASVNAYDFAPRSAALGKTKWSFGRAGCSAWAPFLRDGTAVVPCGTELLWIAQGGQKTQTVAARFSGSLVSVDLDDSVLGFEWEQANVRLVRLTGAKRSEVLLGPRRPLQPPIALPGGRVVVICDGEMVSVRGQAIEWTAPIAESFLSHSDWNRSPVGTGTLDGMVLVKYGPRVWALDARGNVVWDMRVDAPIESNPLLTPEGGVCVATAREVRCAMPRK